MKQAYEKVRDLIDQLGRGMSPQDWIEFLGEIEDDVVAKREAAEAEVEENNNG